MREKMMIAQNHPSQASATHAIGSGSIWETPFHASMDAAALAIGCPRGPVRYVIRFAATPQLYANLSAISIAARSQTNFSWSTRCMSHACPMSIMHKSPGRKKRNVPMTKTDDFQPPVAAREAGWPR
jgi:hypothetical protein